MLKRSMRIAGALAALIALFAAPGAALAAEAGQTQSVDLGDGVSLEVVALPAGKVTMGSAETEAQRREDEGPRIEVEVDAFWMGKTEVTQRQYERVMGVNPSFFKGPDRPVERISWQDAVAFCDKLSSMTGRRFRLPSEAEWEYACRAGSDTAFTFGDDYETLGEYGWYVENSERQTHPVAQKKPNAWGLYDTHGNVWEWCADWYDKDAYDQSVPESEKPKSAKLARVCRGGSCEGYAWTLRSAFRHRNFPQHPYSLHGMRVAMEP